MMGNCFISHKRIYVTESMNVAHKLSILMLKQVDGAYAAVKFPPKESGSSVDGANSDDVNSLLQDLRLLRKDELQVT